MSVPPRRRLLRTIRFDASDTFVFERAAAPGEWAVSGSFAFLNDDPSRLTGKRRQAFANGFLGLTSFGRSTFATVSEASEREVEEILTTLASHFVANFGAPSLDAAWPAAEDEIAFVSDLVAQAPINTVFTVRRSCSACEGAKASNPSGPAEQPSITEEFRTITPPSDGPLHARIWAVDEADADEDLAGSGDRSAAKTHATEAK